MALRAYLSLGHRFSVNSLGVIDKFISFRMHYHTKSLISNHTLKHYLQRGEPIKALLNFRHRFKQSPTFIDSFSVLFVIKASSTQNLSSVHGKQIHCIVRKLGFQSIIQIQTSLVGFYSTVGELDCARQVFDETPDRQNVILWTTMISAYVDNGSPVEAIKLFQRMEAEKIKLDEVILTVTLSACADLGARQLGEQIYSRFIRRNPKFATDLTLRNSFLNMFVKSGDIEKAKKLFDETMRKDVTTYTSMIIGYALNSQPEESLQLFKKMKTIHSQDSSVITPNDVTFIGVLMACSHGGLMEEGKQQFKSMIEDYNLKPRDVHFGCMVDMFCRSGHLKDALEFIQKMPIKPNAVILRTLLSACNIHGNIELGEDVERQIYKLESDHAGDYIAMSNLYASKGMWDEKLRIRNHVKKRRMPGKSWIELGLIITEFVSGEDELEEVREILKCLVACITSYDSLVKNLNSYY